MKYFVLFAVLGVTACDVATITDRRSGVGFGSYATYQDEYEAYLKAEARAVYGEQVTDNNYQKGMGRIVGGPSDVPAS